MKRKFIPFNIGFRIDTGLQLPPILLLVPLFKPTKLNKILFYTEYTIDTIYIILQFYMKVWSMQNSILYEI